MEYKVGDKVIVKVNGGEYNVKIKNIYDAYGFTVRHFFDGKTLDGKHIITFGEYDIMGKILAGPCPCGPKGEEGIKKEEKKYLKTWEAIKALEEGRSIRRKAWTNESYRLYKTKNNDVFETDDNGLNEVLGECFDNLDLKADDWEIYEDHKKEIPKEFEGLKYILGSINNMDCGEKDCDKCPLGIEKCDMLDEIFFDMKEKYNF